MKSVIENLPQGFGKYQNSFEMTTLTMEMNIPPIGALITFIGSTTCLNDVKFHYNSRKSKENECSFHSLEYVGMTGNLEFLHGVNRKNGNF